MYIILCQKTAYPSLFKIYFKLKLRTALTTSRSLCRDFISVQEGTVWRILTSYAKIQRKQDSGLVTPIFF